MLSADQLKAFKLAMDRARFHHESALWFIDPIRGFPLIDISTAMASARHHQFHAARLYAQARELRGDT